MGGTQRESKKKKRSGNGVYLKRKKGESSCMNMPSFREPRKTGSNIERYRKKIKRRGKNPRNQAESLETLSTVSSRTFNAFSSRELKECPSERPLPAESCRTLTISLLTSHATSPAHSSPAANPLNSLSYSFQPSFRAQIS